MQRFGCERWCFRCNEIGHISSECQGSTEREDDVSTSLLPKQVEIQKLPGVKVFLDSESRRFGLLDLMTYPPLIGYFMPYPIYAYISNIYEL